MRIPFITEKSAGRCSTSPTATDSGLFWYTPITPQPDTDDLAKSARLMLYHDRGDGPRLFVAPAGDLQAGWVVGVGGVG